MGRWCMVWLEGIIGVGYDTVLGIEHVCLLFTRFLCKAQISPPHSIATERGRQGIYIYSKDDSRIRTHRILWTFRSMILPLSGCILTLLYFDNASPLRKG